MAQDTAVLGMADQKKVVYALSSGAIFNDTEWPPTQTSR